MLKRNIRTIGILALLAIALPSCAQRTISPTVTAGGVASVQGGGGGVYTNGQFTQGLVVAGTGTASAEPEEAQVTLGLDLRGDDPAALVNEAAQKINAVIAAVQGVGVAQADIQTVNYSLWVETIYDPQTGQPTGAVVYHVSHSIQATVRDLSRVGDCLAAAVGAGANTISGVNFTVQDPDALVEQAREQALTNARAQAEKMAQALDISVGKPVLVMETSGGYPVVAGASGMGGGGGVAAPSISPGAFSVSVSVQVVYEIR